MDKPSVFETLRSDVDRTNAEYCQAKHQFWKVCADVRNLPPNPHGRDRIDLAVRAQTHALTAHVEALRRLNQFLQSGVIPEDVRPDVVVTRDSPAEASTGAGQCVCCGGKTLLRESGHPVCLECASPVGARQRLREQPKFVNGDRQEG